MRRRRLEAKKREQEEEEHRKRQEEVKRVRNGKMKSGRTHQVAVKVGILPHLHACNQQSR